MSRPGALAGVFINLERSPQRRASMEAQLAQARLPYPVGRLAGIDGSRRADCPPGLRAGQFGCWLSHLEALRGAAPGAHLHVMEDDALLSGALGALPGIVEAAEAGSGGDWDLLYLDATLIEVADMYRMYEWARHARERQTVQVHRIPADFVVYGTHSYVVNAGRRQKVLDFLARHLGAGKPIDNAYAHGIQRGELQAFVSAPFVTSGSDLGIERTVGEVEERFLAWLLFRRLCFWDLSAQELEALQRRLAGLRAVDGQAAILGALLGYRIGRWPMQRFPPGLD